jgi:hypothetical protein
MGNKMEIDPKVRQMMLAVPAWIPSSEALILRAIMEGRAKVIWSEYLQGPETGFVMLHVGEPDDLDTDDAFEMLSEMAKRKLQRKMGQNPDGTLG